MMNSAILSEAGAHADWIARPWIAAGGSLQVCDLAEVPERLANGGFNVLLLGRFYTLRRTQGEESAALAALVDAVRDFLAQGGGVFFALPIEGGLIDARPLLDPYGVRIPRRSIEPAGDVHIGAAASGDPSVSAWTSKVDPAFSADVAGVWYPCRGTCAVSTRPVEGKTDDGWFPVVTAMPGSRVIRDTRRWDAAGGGEDDFDADADAEPPPLILARAVGPGRLAVCGIPAGFHLASPHHFPQARHILWDGFDGRPSGLGSLLFNVWNWLGAPSVGRLGGAPSDPDILRPRIPRFPDDPPVAWARRELPRPSAPPRYGLIGARTKYSGGAGTVAEYVCLARARKLDFLVFLEEFACLEPGGLEHLKAECRDHSRDGFLAIPGYTIADVADSRFFQFGPEIVAPDPALLEASGTRLAPAENATGNNHRMTTVHCRLIFVSFGSRCRRGRFFHGQGPVMPEEHRFCDSVALVTWHDGRIVDDQRAAFGTLSAMGMRLNPTVITLLDRPEDMDRALADGWRNGLIEPYAAMPDAVLRKWMAPELEWWGMIDEQRMLDPAFRLGNWQYGLPFQFVTAGPEIQEWTVSVTRRDPAWRAPDTEIPPTANAFRVDVLHFRLRIRVTAREGLVSVRLLDGDQCVRLWRPGGHNEFETELDLLHHQQMQLRLEATDRRGRSAYSGTYATLRLDWCEFYCADRNNPLTIGYECGPEGEAWGWSGTIALNYGIGPWGGTSPTSNAGRLWRGGDPIFPVPCNPVEDERLPTDGGVTRPGGGIHLFPRIPGEETLMVRCVPECISPDVAIHQATMDRRFDPDWPWFFGRHNTGFGLFPSEPTRRVRIERRAQVFRPVPGRLTTLVYDVSLKWLEAPALDAPLRLGWLAGADTVILIDRHGGHQTVAGHGDAPFRDPWRHGEVLMAQNDGRQPALFYNDGPDLILERDLDGPASLPNLTEDTRGRLILRLPLSPAPGTGHESRLRFLALGGHGAAPTPGGAIAILHTLGVDGPPSYGVDVETGRIRSQRLVLALESDRCGVQFHLRRAALPAALPISVRPLNPRWTVALLDRDAHGWRPLGLHGDQAWCVLDPTDRDWRVFIGHPVVADHADLVLNLVQTGAEDWRLEIHNPTDAVIITNVHRAPAFDRIGAFNTRIHLKPGSTEILNP